MAAVLCGSSRLARWQCRGQRGASSPPEPLYASSPTASAGS